MYKYIHDLLSDRKGKEIFRCFGAEHFIFIGLTVLSAVLLALFLSKKDDGTREKTIRLLTGLCFGLYILDFFLMPFAYEEIDIEKLPFHACTAMCVMCFVSTFNKRLKAYRVHFALLGFVSNFVYVVYPAGVMWHAVHPLSYRVVQTLLYHSLMSVSCLMIMIFGGERPSLGKFHRSAAAVCCMTLWALIGNTLYRGSAGSYSNDFNWFFVGADPFGLLPSSAAPYLSPFVTAAAFCAVEALICLIFSAAGRKKQKNN